MKPILVLKKHFCFENFFTKIFKIIAIASDTISLSLRQFVDIAQKKLLVFSRKSITVYFLTFSCVLKPLGKCVSCRCKQVVVAWCQMNKLGTILDAYRWVVMFYNWPTFSSQYGVRNFLQHCSYMRPCPTTTA